MDDGRYIAAESSCGRWRTAADVLIVVVVVAAVIAVCAHAPGNTDAYAQVWRAGEVLGAVEQNEWLLPRNQAGAVARKPQLYIWLDAPVLMLTGLYDDFTYRLPSVAAVLAAAVLVYLTGRRWYGRRTGLLAACLWATALHMGKMTYLISPDMLLALWIAASVFCADRLLFHPAPRADRWKWLVGLWGSMVLGALSKGWGVVNLPLVGGFIALATAVRPAFKALRAVRGWKSKLGLTARLILRRWRRAIEATRLGWGLLVMAAVLVPVWTAMWIKGGGEFQDTIRFEIWQRVTGLGESPPSPSRVPPVLVLLYYLLPVSAAAVGSLFLVRPGRWLGRKSPICLPLCWTAAVVAPFSLAHGFRPDYLLPCYAAVAMMGAWAFDEIASRARRGAVEKVLRHVLAGLPLLIGVGLAVVPAAFLFHWDMPAAVRRSLPLPGAVRPETWYVVAALAVVGAGAVAWSIAASLRWRIRRLGWLAVVGMVGILFLDTHLVGRRAVEGDGEKMVDFARRAGLVIGRDDFAVLYAERLAVELYLGRFGKRVCGADSLGASSAPWLMTCDLGLTCVGAAVEDAEGSYRPSGSRAPFRVLPRLLGDVRVVTEPVWTRDIGRMYLIALRRPFHLPGLPGSLPSANAQAE